MDKRLILALFTASLHAGTYTVTTNTDTLPMGAAGELRDVIETLNALGVPDPDSEIVFMLAPGMETITLAGSLPTLNLNNDYLSTINGMNPNMVPTTIDGANFPGFTLNQIDSAFGFTLQNLTMQNCRVLGADGTMMAPFGDSAAGGSLSGLIFMPGSIVFEDVQFLSSVAQGGNAFGPPGTGGSAQGGAVYYFGLSPFIVQGSAVFDGAVLPGSPAPVPNTSLGWSMLAASMGMGPFEFNPGMGDTISFTDSFQIIGDLEQNGPGTVSLSTTSTAQPSGDSPFDPGVYYVSGSVSVNQGTFRLDGQTFQTPEGALLPLPAFGTQFGDFTLAGIATLSGNGILFASEGFSTFISGAVRPDPGILMFLGDVFFQAGSEIYTAVSPAATSMVMHAGFPMTSPPLDLTQATLNIDLQSGAYTSPAVYALFFSDLPFNGLFQQIVVTSNSMTLATSSNELSFNFNFDGNPSTILYSPLSAPNSILMPFNIPFGATTADIVIGEVTIPSLVLYDPCAGLIVISLLSPGSGAAALATFFANQSSLTTQALGSITFGLNEQCVRKRSGGAAHAGGPVVNWGEERNLLLVQNASDAAPPRPPREEPEEEKKPERPLFFPQKKKKPNYSLSLTPLGQFQEQDEVLTSTAYFPSYRTKTGGAILGVDYIGMETILVGGAATYAFTDLTVGDGGGGQQTWSVFGTAYSSFTFDHFFFSLLATGSYNHNSAVRKFAPVPGETLEIQAATPLGIRTVYTFDTAGIPGGTAFSKYSTYQLVPHVDFNYEIGFGPSFSLVPFLLSDCSISFTDTIVETGDSVLALGTCGGGVSLNTEADALTTFMLQSEAGVNFFEQMKMTKGRTLIFRQKASYVNRYTVPYTSRSKLIDSESYVETPVSLPMQHMFGAAAEMIFRRKWVSAIFTYEGFIGSGFMSNAGYCRLAFDF